MALVLKDRVKETTTTTGTGTVTLAGAAAGFQSFAAVGDGNDTYYAIVDAATGDWEVGVGTYTASGTTLSRSTVLSSSNAGSLVPFSAGSKDVFVTYPSSRSVYQNTTGTETVQNDFGTANITTANITTANITAGTVTTTPTSGNDIANKTYVDTLVSSGITYHAPVKYEVPDTTGNLNANYNNGTGGVGATLTNAGTLVAFTPDGVTAVIGDRILIYNQTNQFENGIYEVTTVGDGSTAWVLTRTADADSYGLKDVNSLGNGDAFFVTSGNTGKGETYVCNTAGVITFGTTAITFVQVSSAQIYSAGTGLTLTNTTFSISDTGVSAAAYGSASSVPVITLNAQGQVTAVTDTTIAISGAAVSGNITGQAGSVANALTAGTYLTSTGTYDGSVARTFSVDATDANTASKVVARDASGNFSAGTITATLSGSATSATTATNLAGGAANQIAYQSGAGATTFATAPSASNQVLNWNGSAFTWSAGTISGIPLGSNLNTLTLGSYLTGTSYNGSANVTAAVDATDANTASKVVARDASGNFSAGTITATLSGNATNVTGTVAVANGGTGATTPGAALTSLGAYPASNPNGYTSNTGTVTSVGGTGTVNGISLSGTVTTSGNLTLGGTLSNVSLTTQVTGTLPVANGGTGATSLTANNVILGNGTSAVQVVAPGTSGNVLTSNGTTWTSAAGSSGLPGLTAELFTSSGTFTVPTGVTRVKVTVVGAGGGGGSTGAVNAAYGAGGGGGGGTAIEYISGLTPGDNITVTVGTSAAATAGGTSSFGAYCSATGGAAGTTGTSGNYNGLGGAAGSGSGGNFNYTGGPGSGGVNSCPYAYSGSGGGSLPKAQVGLLNPGAGFLGGAGGSGRNSLYNSAGNAGTGYGNGGGGAIKDATTTVFSGGAGSSGVVVVEY